ncbi:MAG TPA: FG-GAP-like repeat-containing protein [Vicinamibacterales bacterium]|nr:FG-GAP-like repeat-containing protein [Vicinamibacterales bacterium]
MNKTSRSIAFLLAGVLLAGAAIFLVVRGRNPSLPAPGSDTYEQMTRAFYWGLSALEVGLLDDARQQFTKATTIVPQEPAAWANLGLTQLRLGELEAAAAPVERALELAPNNGDVVLLAARMEAARGRLDEAVVRLRRAVELDPDGLRARFALADELQRLNTPEADAEALSLLDEIVRRSPNNLAALIERARIAARRRDEARLRGSREALTPLSSTWPQQALEQFQAFQSAVDERRFEDLARATTFLRNVLAPVPAFRESLTAVRTPTELIAEPFDRFVALVAPPAQPSPADPSITFAAEAADNDAAAALLTVFPTIEAAPILFAADATNLRRLDGSAAVWPFPTSAKATVGKPSSPSSSALVALDWNHDFRTDIAMGGRGGIRLLLQDEKGGFSDATAKASSGAPVSDDIFGVWAADVEMDGDIDLVVGATEGSPFVLRNNGDGTWRRIEPFSGLAAVRGFGWADLDQDADADAVFLDRAGRLHVFTNRQAGQFVPAAEVSGIATVVAMTVADVDANGAFDLIALESSGTVRQVTWQGTEWRLSDIAMGLVGAGADPGTYRLIAADFDNSGALDLLAAGGGTSLIWLAGQDYRLEALPTGPAGQAVAVADRNGDGRLDLAALAMDRPVWLMGGGGTAAYHWKVIRPRGQATAGDQRINSFGAGGEISVRSGLTVQTQVMSGTPVHFGLGARTGIDVARIVWPNGNAQAEFGTGVDDVIVAEQRLKGSCPWVFAWDGTRMSFVTDFLWRSPLGLRINAQDTAGVSQTEDWVRIAGAQLRPRDHMYDVRITAELWETHFFDHVSLLVVDHPADTEMFVDERFQPAERPALAPRAMRLLGPVARARDESGRDVTDVIAARDGRYLSTFAKGQYQGIAQEHFVEFELGDHARTDRLTLVASGWIYPTDSSINVAIGQGGVVKPSGLVLEALDGHDRWVAVNPDLGFPAGKNKTMLIDLTGVGEARRLRLRTNLEIYWDALTLAREVDGSLRVRRLPLADAELRYRGFSETTSLRSDAPETPDYDRKAGVTQRWRDLVGYHTRFGNVNALLSEVDDRYVIMNAGDEMRLRFPEQPAPESGWRRDFVLIGDGWEKDGDYNTGFSQTVLPLPSHDRPAYGARGQGSATGHLEDDPVYQRHRADWDEYHTRWVEPSDFIRGIRGRESFKQDTPLNDSRPQLP